MQNAQTGEVLASDHASDPVAIASITKLMTVLVVLERRKLSEVVAIDPRIPYVAEESVRLRAGELLSVRELVKAALIKQYETGAPVE